MKHAFHNKFRMIIFHDLKTLSLNFKSSRSPMFFKIDVLKKAYRKTRTRNPSGTLEKPENRDPSGTLEKAENQEPSGTLAGP